MFSKNFMVSLPQRKTIFWLLLLLTAVLLIWHFTRYRPGGRVREGDYLIYQVDEGKLIFYDPFTNEHRPILEGWAVTNHLTLAPRWLAFSTEKNIYLLDYPFTDTPQNITTDQFETAYPMSWSTDGRYLIYFTTLQETEALWVWDAQTQQSTPINQLLTKFSSFPSGWDPAGRYFAYGTETKDANLWVWDSKIQQNLLIYSYFDVNRNFYFEWGPNGQLVFSPEQLPNELFLWNGQHVVNLSQTPDGLDNSPVWNQDGQLAFQSILDVGVEHISVWDGISKVDNAPDKNSFTHLTIPPRNIASAVYLQWVNKNLLSFYSNNSSPIFQWDGTAITPIYNTATVYSHSWYKDGYWYILFFPKTLHIRNPSNQTVVTDEVLYDPQPIWSEHGLLAYCAYNKGQGILKLSEIDDFLLELRAGATFKDAYRRASTKNDPKLQLVMWSGESTTVNITQGDMMDVFWSNNQRLRCYIKIR